MRHLPITVLLSVWLIMTLPIRVFGSCGNISIANTQTPSSSLLAHVDKFILTHGFGCKVVLINGTNRSIISRMIQTGQPDMAPEIWTHPVKEEVKKARKEQLLFPITESIISGGEEGFWVPAYLIKDNESLLTIEGIKTHADLFKAQEIPSRSVIYGCRPGWDCQNTVNHLFSLLNLKAAGFDVFNTDTAESFDQAIEQSYNKQLPWVGYYHSPSTIMARFPMTKVGVDASQLSEAEVYECITLSKCPEKQKSLYPVSKIQTVLAQDFAYRAVPAHNYLYQRQLTRQQLNTMLVWMHEKKAGADEAARYFLVEHEKIWRPWLSFYEIGKVRRALNPR